MNISNQQNDFLIQVSDFLDLPLCHPLREGITGIPKIEKPVFEEIRNPYDVRSNELVGTPHDNDVTYRDLAVYELFRKARFDLPEVDPYENAKTSFLAQMSLATANSSRFRRMMDIPVGHDLWTNVNYVAFRKIMESARYYCHILCDQAEHTFRTRGIIPRFTDGATIGRDRDLKKGNSPIERFSQAALSEDVAYLGKALGVLHGKLETGSTGSFWESFLSRAEVISKIDTANFVSKTYMTDRPTFKSVVGDIAIQCGIGDVLTTSLRSSGYDVSTLPDTHKELARLGSISGLTATFDMKGGSDNVYLELGKYMVPELTFDIMAAARCSKLRIDDQVIDLPIMATAGNGFCFPLETIIFLSLQMGILSYFGVKPKIAKRQVRGASYRYIRKTSYHSICSTFGDDVIIPTFAAKTFIEVFDKLGIILNLEKSFFTGSFRESCGGHYLNGHDVNCFNSKTVPTPENTYEIQKFLNGIRRFGYDNNRSTWRHPDLASLWFGILQTTGGLNKDFGIHASSGGLVINQGVDSDSGVLIPRTYSVTSYVRRCNLYIFTETMQRQIRDSKRPNLKTLVRTHVRETHRYSKIRSVRSATGYPSMTQKFRALSYTDKISLPGLLQRNPIPSLPLFKIAGEGLLSGAGLTPTASHQYDEKPVSVRTDEESSKFNAYPKHFVTNRLKTRLIVTSRDPNSITDESVEDLFKRIGDSFNTSRISRIKHECYRNRRLSIWEARRPEYLSILMQKLCARNEFLNEEIRDIFR